MKRLKTLREQQLGDCVDLAVAGRDPDIIRTLSDFITNLKTVKVELWQASSKYSDASILLLWHLFEEVEVFGRYFYSFTF